MGRLHGVAGRTQGKRSRARAAIGITLSGLTAAATLLAAGGSAPAAPAVGDGDGGVKLKSIARLDSPVFAATAPGKANRKLLFVVEQGGTVRVLKKNRLRAKPFLDLSDQVLAGGERGLLSIAFDPRYAKNRRLYAYFTDPEGDIRVSQYRRKNDSKLRASNRARPVIEIAHRDAGNHNGGTVAFGPDRKMYLATGDGGGGCDSFGNAQHPGSLLGKLLRIDPKARRGYEVPSDNPFLGTGARNEIYALGLRNPFRFSFDRRQDAIVIGDVGQSSWEEIDFETLLSARGANFGWNTFEGNHASGCGGDFGTPTPEQHSEPIHEYPHDGGGHAGCSVTGGVVVRDKRLPSLYGRYVFADFCTGDLRSLIGTPGGADDEGSAGVDVPSPTSFASGRRGKLYITSQAGSVYRVLPDGGRGGREPK